MHTLIQLAIDYIGEPLGMLLVNHPLESTVALGITVAAMYGFLAVQLAANVLRGGSR